MTEHEPPRVENAPGIAWRKLKGGWEARWRPRHDLVLRGLPMKQVRLWLGWDASDVEKKWLSDVCTALQSEMLVWSRGNLPCVGTFDGTINGLITLYRADPDSTYRKLRYGTRVNYDNVMDRIAQNKWIDENGVERVIGEMDIRDIKARTVLRWHELWSAGGKLHMGHRAIGMLRTIINYGATFLEDAECERVSSKLHGMRFPQGKPRGQIITADQVVAVRAKAHELGRHSIALAQAFQFELMLRQRDVIGEWMPISEPVPSAITDGNAKWARGLRWNEIDANLILRHVTSKRQKEIIVDLRKAPMVMEELELVQKMHELPSDGPVIVYERTGRPYIAHQFRHAWRTVADATGIPRDVRNMDSRAGAISEATDAGADLEHVRHAATHSDIAMTQRYSRAGEEKTAKVMELRAANRK